MYKVEWRWEHGYAGIYILSCCLILLGNYLALSHSIHPAYCPVIIKSSSCSDDLQLFFQNVTLYVQLLFGSECLVQGLLMDITIYDCDGVYDNKMM